MPTICVVTWVWSGILLVSAIAHGDPGTAFAQTTLWGQDGLQEATAVVVDPSGNTYAAGWTDSADFPLVNAALSYGGGVDGFLIKLDPLWNITLATYIGGDGDDRLTSLGLDNAGNIYVAGNTTSSLFEGHTFPNGSGSVHGVVAKLDPTGTRVLYAVTIGGSGEDEINAISVQPSGNVVLAGDTTSPDLPVRDAEQGVLRGTSNGFVAKLDPSGSVIFCTYLGGSGRDSIHALAVDGSGNVWLAGTTSSADFPVVTPWQGLAGVEDAFVSELSPGGAALLFSTYLGGSGGGLTQPEEANAIAVDSIGNVYVAGATSSADFPVLNALQAAQGSWGTHAFLTSLSGGGSLLFSTYLGGSGFDLATCVSIGRNRIIVSGYTTSSDFPGTIDAQEFHTLYNGFYAEFDMQSTELVLSAYVDFGLSDSVLASAATTSLVLAGASAPTSSRITAVVSLVSLDTPAQFNDVLPDATYYDAANLMYLAGVTTGCVQSSDPAARQFCPDDNVTRQEMAAFLVRAVTGTTTPVVYNRAPYFWDVKSSNPFFPHIQKMMDLGITTGCSQNPPLFCPSDTIPRWEMAIFMVRARLALYGAPFTTATTPYFADVPPNVEGNGMPFPFIQRSYEEHITNGCGNNDYCPDKLVTRGQMASFIMRGLFNATMVLPASSPLLTGVSPSAVSQTVGSSITVTITGVNTNFRSGDTVSVPSGMLTAGIMVVNSPTSMMATLTVNANAVAGPQALVVTTAGQNLTLPLAIRVGSY